MAKTTTTFDEAVSVVSRLSSIDKVRLVERLASMLENDLSIAAGELPELIDDLMPTPMTFKELAAWLDANPAPEPWGDLREDEDAADHVRRMRRQSSHVRYR